MKKNAQIRIHCLGAALAVAMLAACSSTPRVAGKDGATAAPASTPAAAVSDASAPAATAASAASTAQTASTSPKKRSGYRLRKRGDETVYCRKETTLGSNIPQEMCYTEEQMAEIERKTEAMTEDMRQRMGTHICGANCPN